jgi:hypothetical protein
MFRKLRLFSILACAALVIYGATYIFNTRASKEILEGTGGASDEIVVGGEVFFEIEEEESNGQESITEGIPPVQALVPYDYAQQYNQDYYQWYQNYYQWYQEYYQWYYTYYYGDYYTYPSSAYPSSVYPSSVYPSSAYPSYYPTNAYPSYYPSSVYPSYYPSSVYPSYYPSSVYPSYPTTAYPTYYPTATAVSTPIVSATDNYPSNNYPSNIYPSAAPTTTNPPTSAIVTTQITTQSQTAVSVSTPVVPTHTNPATNTQWAPPPSVNTLPPNTPSAFPSVSTVLTSSVKNAPGSGKYQLLEDSYSFINNYPSYGISQDYKIPYDIFVEALGAQRANVMYQLYGKWAGDCLGFSMTSGLIFMNYLKLDDYAPGFAEVFDVPAPGSHDHKVTRLLEFYQAAQLSENIMDKHEKNVGNMRTIIEKVKNFEANGTGAFSISIYANNQIGHAIFPYAVTNDSAGNYVISVYDCNEPGVNKTLTINKNMNAFSYELMNYGTVNYLISYMDSADFINEQSLTVHSADTNRALIAVNREDAIITNSAGKELKDIPGAYRVRPLGFKSSAILYSVPEDDYKVVSPGASKLLVNSNDLILNLASSANSSAFVSLSGKPNIKIDSANKDNIKLNVTSYKSDVKNFSFEGEITAHFEADLSGDVKLFGNFKENK